MDDIQMANYIPTLDEVFGLILSIDNIDTLRTSTVRAYLDILGEDQLASVLQTNPGSDSQQFIHNSLPKQTILSTF
ncbi:unnamed protein product [Absidia cylindrospora]